ncbi:MAG: hypothetical protein RL681_380 [Candidatus Parcubacteria bacterium]|jgi:hypothetical protein
MKLATFATVVVVGIMIVSATGPAKVDVAFTTVFGGLVWTLARLAPEWFQARR